MRSAVSQARAVRGWGSASRRHLEEAGEGYGQHMRFALRYAGRCLLAAGAAAVHAVVPGLFQRSASRIVADLAAGRGGRATTAPR